MARLVIDARESGTSTGRYIDKLVEYLDKLSPDFEVLVLTKPHRLDYLKRVAPSFHVLEADFKEFTFSEQLAYARFLHNLKPDLVHFGKDHQPILYRGKVVTTMHDLTTARFRNPNKNFLIFAFKQLVYKQVVRIVAHKSKFVITPTEFVKKDVVRYGHINPDKVVVTHEAADPFDEPAEAIKRFEGKDFIMFNGRPLPHKNLERLIRAFALLHSKHPKLYLMIAGKKDRSHATYETLARQLGVGDRVILTDWISDGQLKWAMQHTKVYVYPSLSEGFGLPPLEAMLCGAPVVASNATCIPEVLGDAARYFNPLDVEDMASAIEDVLSNEKLRSELIARGQVQARKYSWRRMTEQTLAVYKEVLGS